MTASKTSGLAQRGLVAPRYSTPLTPGRDNQVAVYERLAKALGYGSLLPWQRYVVALATETGTDGLPQYSEINLTLPRQNGKSVLMALVFLVRLLAWPGDRKQVVMLGAQDALSARRLLTDNVWPTLEHSGVADAAGMRLRAGGLVDLRCKNGNHLYVMSSNAASGHGTTLSCAIMDECWALSSDAAIQAVGPAMVTVADAQLWLSSTMGDQSSTFWQAKVDYGRAISRSKKATDAQTAYVEWSAPDGADCDDPAVWRAANPALGTLITEERIATMREQQTESAFRRAALNQIVTNAIDRVIPDAAWQACQASNRASAPKGGVVLGIDATPERSAAAVVAADQDGRIEVVEHKAGADWVNDYVCEVYRRHGDILGVSVITNGPLAGTIEHLKRERVPVYSLSASHSAAATATFYDAAVTTKLAVRSDYGLDAAVAAATRRQVGQAWAWGRASIDLDVSPLIAATLAYSVAVDEATKPPIKAPEVVDLTAWLADDSDSAESEQYAADVAAWSQVSVSS